MPGQSPWRNINGISQLLYIVAEHTQAADPAAMIHFAFIRTFPAPLVAKILCYLLFRKTIVTEKGINTTEHAGFGMILKSQGPLCIDQADKFIPEHAVILKITQGDSPPEEGHIRGDFSGRS